jgi:DNA-binding NtrC family response regulator
MEKRDFKILVAEDDSMVRDVIVKFLTEEKYPVVVANDGIEAIKLLRLEDIKLVLTDLRMPGADGMEVLRAAVRTDPDIAVVLLTAYGTLDTALEAMREGAYDYVVKPFVMQQLLLVVRNAFRMSNLLEENQKLSYYLKEMYRNLEAMKMLKNDRQGAGKKASRKKAGSLENNDIATADCNTLVKEKKLLSEDVKKYSALINELKDTDLLADNDM